MIRTARLSLIPATVPLARAELYDRVEFARLLSAVVPENWPPETSADALPFFLEWLEAAPEEEGWFGWYVLATVDSGTGLVLTAGAGFKGPPTDGVVEIGYSVLPQFQNRGVATEVVSELVRWALAQPGVSRVVAETEGQNPASERVLRKAGFAATGSSASGGSWFEIIAARRR